jgi:RNA 3'-terminal phosphate cyclase (ATP)
MKTIDGSMGEGGGQILRTALALSLVTGAPFRATRVRAGRARPGLMRQHLVAVEAAAAIAGADVEGAAVGSTELVFRPRAVRGGEHTFAIGGAGSTTLVFQTVVLPLLVAAGAPSTLRLEGGTHNPMAPPFDFLAEAWAPLVARMGARVDLALERHGFYPVGGGAFTARVAPCPRLGRLELLDRGAIGACSARAIVSAVPGSVAVRELDTLAAALGWDRAACKPLVVRAAGPGNALLATVRAEHVTEVFVGFGERGVRAEAVAAGVAAEAKRWLDAGVPVGEHLADQLLLPMALGAGGAFRTLAPSSHTRTQVALLRDFLGKEVALREEASGAWRVEVPG